MPPDPALRLGIGAAFAVWFWTVYGAANWWTSRLTDLPSVRLSLDDAIPFLPGWAWIYMTVSLALALPLLLLTTRNLVALALALAVEVAIAGLVFLAFPVAPSAHPPGPVPEIFALADWVNLTYNSVPSLHVALSVTCALAMTRQDRPGRSALLTLWAAAISVSTLFTYQHLLVDVVAGLALAGFGLWLYGVFKVRVKNAAMSRRISGI